MKREYTPNSLMNITSLVDVALNLLIIFMIASPLIHSQIDVNLPESKAKTISNEESFTISITKDGRVYLGQKLINIQNITSTVKELKETKGMNTIAIRGDKDVNYGLVMQVMDNVKEAGMENVGLVIAPKSTVKP